jgi:para-aminobenzoate synthetase component 1
MEIITELERTARGAYCGSIGYVGLDQQADFNLLIRTITASKGWWQFPVGGAVVAESDPELEYEETWVKAAGLLQACRKANSLPPNSADKPSTGLHSTVP